MERVGIKDWLRCQTVQDQRVLSIAVVYIDRDDVRFPLVRHGNVSWKRSAAPATQLLVRKLISYRDDDAPMAMVLASTRAVPDGDTDDIGSLEPAFGSAQRKPVDGVREGRQGKPTYLSIARQ